MDALTELLEKAKSQRLTQGRLIGLFHVLIGRRITNAQGVLVSPGLTFRDLAALLKKVRWDPEDIQGMGVAFEGLPPRDRQRFWFSVICQARLDSIEAQAAGEDFAAQLAKAGYQVGPAPRPAITV